MSAVGRWVGCGCPVADLPNGRGRRLRPDPGHARRTGSLRLPDGIAQATVFLASDEGGFGGGSACVIAMAA